MSDPHIREVGSVETEIDGPVSIGVDYDTVAIFIGGWLSADGVRLARVQAEEFGQMFIRACWKAARQGGAP